MATPKAKTFSDSLMKGDWLLWLIYFTFLIISVVEMYSASSSLAYRAHNNSAPVYQHAIMLIGGFLLVVVVQNLHRNSIRLWGQLFYYGGIILLIVTAFFGRNVQGAHRDFAGIQPSELLCKDGLLIYLCYYITSHYNPTIKGFTTKQYAGMLVMIACVCVPIFFQNLSTALIIGFVCFGTMAMGRVQFRLLRNTILTLAAIGGVLMGALYLINRDDAAHDAAGQSRRNLYVLNRAHTWSERIFDHDSTPLWERDPSGRSSQEIYAHMAIANSYPTPGGPGGSQLRDYLPEAYSDYLFAIIFEELGTIGAAFVIALYLILLLRAYFIARKCDDPFYQLLMVSMALLITIQALIHVGVCTGAMFVTGQPLPFLSRGGSSILGMSIAYGVMIAISRHVELQEQRKQAEAEAAPTTVGE
jgi:cell division protein FtsW